MKQFLAVGVIIVVLSTTLSIGQDNRQTRYLPENKLREIRKLLKEVEENPTDKSTLIERLGLIQNLSAYLVKQGFQLESIPPVPEVLGKVGEEIDPALIDKTVKELCKIAQEPIIVDRFISVDCSKETGRIKPLTHVNDGPLHAAPGIVKVGVVTILDYSKQYQKLGITNIRIHDAFTHADTKIKKMRAGCDISVIFPDYSLDPDKEENYNFEWADTYIKAIKDIGVDIFYLIGESCPSKLIVPPPKDPDHFARLATNVVRHFNQGWANGFHYNIKYWEFWDEPNEFLWETPEKFFKFYEKTARAIKKMDKSLKIGGPLNTPRNTFNKAWGRDFLKYCKDNNVPLDFFSWQWYTSRPIEILKTAQKVRKMLNDLGLNNVESILAEWNEAGRCIQGNEIIWRPNLREFLRTTFNGVYTSAILTYLQDSDVVFAFRYRGDGDVFGMFEYDGTYSKPAYAFKAFKELLNCPIRLELKGLEELPEGLAAIAGISGDKKSIAVLISDYREGENPYQLTLRKFPFTKGKFTLERYILDGDKNLELVESKNVDGQNEITLNHGLQGPAVELLIFKKD